MLSRDKFVLKRLEYEAIKTKQKTSEVVRQVKTGCLYVYDLGSHLNGRSLTKWKDYKMSMSR